MFFSETILTRKGPFANIWLAAHWERKLTKSQVTQTDLHTSITELITGNLPPMAIRLTGQLLLGATKIYSRKARYLYDDCSDAIARIQVAYAKVVDKSDGLNMEQSKADIDAITLPVHDQLLEAPTNIDELLADTLEGDVKDIEMGLGITGRPSEQSIEVGRRVDSLLPSEIAAVASPTQMLVKEENVEAPLIDHEDPYYNNNNDNLPVNDDWPIQEQQNEQPLLFTSPQPVKKTPRKRRAGIPLDTITEFTNNEIQSHVRNRTDVLLSEQDSEEAPDIATPQKRLRQSQVANLLDKPLMGMGAAFEGLDDMFAAKVTLMSPIRQGLLVEEPRFEVDNDYNNDYQVPDMGMMDAPFDDPINNPMLLAEQPTGVPQNILNSRETATTITHWQQMFGKSKSDCIPLTDLMPKRSRRAAASTFFEALVLGTRGLVRVNQSKPYGRIDVEAMPSLYA